MEKSVLDRIIDLSGQNLVIFYGTGISPNSGIPLSKPLISEIIDKHSPKLFAKEFKKAVEKLPLEMLLGTLKENSDISEILKVFLSSRPNKNHLMISELARRGLVKVIITTNFDTLIEQSFEDYGLVAERDFLVYSDE